jgi:hypothetical protein
MTERDVVTLVEAITPIVRDVVTKAIADVAARQSVVDLRLARLDLAETAIADLGKESAAIRERLAVVETRPPTPGPSGPPGPPGADGLHGKDGTPGLVFRGVYVREKQYDVGDVVTWAGSAFHCNGSTTSKPGESKDWTLMVKRGQDGRDAARG